MKTLAASLARHPFVRFAFIGGLGYFVNLAALWLFTHELGLNSYLGGALSIFTAMIFTWRSDRSDAPAMMDSATAAYINCRAA